MDYSAVAPPAQNANYDPQSAFADALARARQIAAKLNNSTPDSSAETVALKRPFEDSQPEAKKLAGPMSGEYAQQFEPFGDFMSEPHAMINRGAPDINAQLQALANQSHSSSAIKTAASVAAQINAKLGASNSQPPPTAAPMPAMSMGPHAGGGGGGLGSVITEDYSVPDRMVGLIIGKGGEQITSIQAETGCKVQFAPDSCGLADRPCTLTGSGESIVKAKEIIDRIIQKGQGIPDATSIHEGLTMVEIMVPGNKVGLVIGKGGENIKQLQERTGVKMVMIQESNQPTMHDKPLRITGDPGKCQQAKEMVLELLNSKDDNPNYGMMNTSDYGEKQTIEIQVPRQMVGVVIGKGGDMIKKITQETGAKVQFLPDDGQGPERTCACTGSQDKAQQAANMVSELIQNAMQRGPPGMGRGRGRGMGPAGGFDGPGGPRPGGGGGGGGGGRGRGFGDNGFQDETTYNIPAEKCGLVIGKGGETIREVNRISGAHVELSRGAPPNPGQKAFVVRGSPEQIQHAVQLICEKAGLPPPGPAPSNAGGAGGGPSGPGQGGPPGGPGGYDQYQQYGSPYSQQNSQPQQPPQSYAPQGWSNAYQQWQQSSPSDPSKNPNDQNAAAWAAYYAQFYGQQPQAQQQQQPPQQQPPAQPSQAPQSPQQPAVNPATGQLDYSAAWAEYYRQQGLHQHAQAILQQAQGGQPPQPPQ